MIIRGLQTVAEERRLIVLDLGYSRNQASCAIVATDPPTRRDLTFGEAIEVALGFLVEPVPSILILEAVLSTYHRPDGNPDSCEPILDIVAGVPSVRVFKSD